MEVKAEVVEGTAKKSGKSYVAIRLVIGDYQNIVYFLSKSEIALLQLAK